MKQFFSQNLDVKMGKTFHGNGIKIHRDRSLDVLGLSHEANINKFSRDSSEGLSPLCNAYCEM